jgi:serine O-acetyltransferase
VLDYAPAIRVWEFVVAQSMTARVVGIAGADPLFARIRQEAEEAARREPELGLFLAVNVLNHDTLEAAVSHRVASRLDHRDLPAALIRQTFEEAIARDPSIGEAFHADLMAVADRDPACLRMMEPLLYFKGFQALQAYRLSHWLLKSGKRDLALSLQSLVSAVFGIDINPAARIGKGLFLDHATSLVVGETTVIEDNVSILQGVTLGGTGKETGDRHPKIRYGVLIGAGAKILGNIEIGRCARVAAGSVVLQPVPHNKTVAGVPARIVGEAGCAEPARDMNQILAEKAFEA